MPMHGRKKLIQRKNSVVEVKNREDELSSYLQIGTKKGGRGRQGTMYHHSESTMGWVRIENITNPLLMFAQYGAA